MSPPLSKLHRGSHLGRTIRFGHSASLALAVTLAVLLSPRAWPVDPGSSTSLADLTIEQLMNESVTSVSKKAISLDLSPAAISIVTPEDLRRLGLTTLPEALRLVPGLNVARVGADQWAVSSRGFNTQYANKLLVLMDGRSIYTPAFGGVFWNAQDTMLEDLERIEVIRGPGATLWGANAVNGVINLTSKHSKDTQGLLASTTFGTEDQPGVSLRYGGAVGPDLHYRAYVKYFNRAGLVDAGGNETPDAWDSIRGGFRADWEPSREDLVTLQGDYYSLHTGGNLTTPLLVAPFSATYPTDNQSHGGNVLGRWTHTFSEKSQLSLQAYFDGYHYHVGRGAEARETADIQLEDRFALGGWNDIVWGLGYRFTTDQFTAGPQVSFNPASTDLNLYTAFVQDEVTLVPGRLRLTLGSKFEHNDYTGWEIQPSARLLWTPVAAQTVWASASRAVGTPARVFRSGRVSVAAFQPPASPVVETALFGNANVVSESVDAYEIGYRIEPARNLSLDLVAFYNVYDHLSSATAGAARLEATPSPHVLVPIDFGSSEAGDTYGAEASIQWKPLDRWRLTANYSWLQADLHPSGNVAKGSPQQQVSLRSYLDLPGHLELNGFASYVDRVAFVNTAGTATAIPAYLRVDVGVVWHPRPNLEVGVWGQNLLDNQHPEAGNLNTSGITEIPRSVFGKITIRF